jgi:hypothetical protein
MTLLLPTNSWGKLLAMALRAASQTYSNTQQAVCCPKHAAQWCRSLHLTSRTFYMCREQC